MIADRLENNFFNFRFPRKEGYSYGFNLYGFVNGREVMLIDSAFRSQARVVKKYLDSEGLKLTHVLLSHFHNDHVSGLLALDSNITVMGSPHYGETLSKELSQTVTPVSFTEEFRFGEFQLHFTPAPGHSPCSIFIDINGEYLHAGDNLMGRYDRKALLPWVEFHNLEQHISSLKLLKGMNRNRILLSHGPELTGEKEIAAEIDNRLNYLTAVFNTGGNCTYEEAVSRSSCTFVGEEFFYELTGKTKPT